MKIEVLCEIKESSASAGWIYPQFKGIEWNPDIGYLDLRLPISRFDRNAKENGRDQYFIPGRKLKVTIELEEKK